MFARAEIPRRPDAPRRDQWDAQANFRNSEMGRYLDRTKDRRSAGENENEGGLARDPDGKICPRMAARNAQREEALPATAAGGRQSANRESRETPTGAHAVAERRK